MTLLPKLSIISPRSLRHMKKVKALIRGAKDGKDGKDKKNEQHLQEDDAPLTTTNLLGNKIGRDSSPSETPAAAFSEGIKELHPCDDAVVDICFVHGLTGDRERTWTAKGQEALWPQLLLPHRVKRVRILSWGYDAYLVRKGIASSNRLIDHATNLINDLIADRAEHQASSRSIIFVAHSLGGLVCKQAIITSRDSPMPHLKEVFTLIKGFVFMGTPHSGSWMASWAKIPVWGLGVVKSANTSLLSILQTEDQLLESLQISFLSMVRDLRDNHQRQIEVTCFFEQLLLPVVGLVVSKASATFADHAVMSIYADHSDMVKFATAEDIGFKRVAGELVRWERELCISVDANFVDADASEPPQRRRTSDSVGNVHWSVTRSVNSLFVGRESILNTIEESIRHTLRDVKSTRQQRLVITGLGGQGKSEICLQIADRVRQLFWGVFWVDVSTETLAESGFLDIAHRLQMQAKTLDEVRRALANIEERWLLILDNADDRGVDYQCYFPTGSRGVVMLTSRNEECHQYATEKAVALDGLSEDEAGRLLIQAARISEDRPSTIEAHVQAVVSLLNSHPLALIQAGSYIGRGHCTLAEYPQTFTRQRKRLLEFRPDQARSRYGDVYTTFEASAEALQSSIEAIPASSTAELARDALELLPVLANCGPSRLPLLVFEAGWRAAQEIGRDQADEDEDSLEFTSWHVSHLPSFVQGSADTWDSFRLTEAVHLCKAFALVSTDTQDGLTSVSMHPLVHAWTRDRADAAEQHKGWLTTGCLIAASGGDDEVWLQHRRQLQPHLQLLITWDSIKMFGSEPSMKVTSILVYCGQMLLKMRDDARLFTLMTRLFDYLGLDREKVETKWLVLYDLTARNFVVCGKAEEAVSLLEQVVKIQEQTLVEDDPYRMALQHALAQAYEANGQVEQAVSLLEQVVKIKEQTLTEDHPDRLASQHELARAYKANGLVEQAVSLLEQVVKIKEETLAEDHPSWLASQHSLAICYWELGYHNNAAQMMRQVVEIGGQVFDEEHPDLKISESWLTYMENELRERRKRLQSLLKPAADDSEHRPGQSML